jgi:hypothetical protein
MIESVLINPHPAHVLHCDFTLIRSAIDGATDGVIDGAIVLDCNLIHVGSMIDGFAIIVGFTFSLFIILATFNSNLANMCY